MKVPGTSVNNDAGTVNAIKLIMLASIIKREGFLKKVTQSKLAENFTKMWAKYPRTALYTLYEMIKNKSNYQDIDIQGVFTDLIKKNPSLLPFETDKLNELIAELDKNNNIDKA